MPKVCLVIIDGLRRDTALEECGYLIGAVEAGQAKYWDMITCLPTISAAMYETIHTGVEPIVHGILGNDHLRASTQPNVFAALKAAGKSGAAVAHNYFHDLYGGSRFDPFEHLEIDDPNAPIPYARYYTMHRYDAMNSAVPAEIDLCAQTWTLASRYEPDYLLLHTCSCDTLGHWYTGDSREYRIQAEKVDSALSHLIPRLRGAGYDVLVTADHGMNADGQHGGNQACLREVAFFAFSNQLTAQQGSTWDQRAIAPTILELTGTPIPHSMKHRAPRS